jgi:tetratricopeptide (TPR) repeat protein
MATKGNPGGPKGRPPSGPTKPEGGGQPKVRRAVGLEGETPAIERSKKAQPRSLKEILGDENAPPTPEMEAAKKKGVKAWHPDRVKQFLRGQITLGDLEGITKPEQYEMAKIGYSYLTSGKLDKAKTVFEGLLALDPFDAYFHTALGSIAQQQNNLAEAEARYSRALEINPFSPSALANRGEIRVMNGRLTEGSEDLLRALKEDPGAREPSTIRARATLQAIKEQLQAANVVPAPKKEEAGIGSKISAATAPPPPNPPVPPRAAAAPSRAQPRAAPRARRPAPRAPKKK